MPPIPLGLNSDLLSTYLGHSLDDRRKGIVCCQSLPAGEKMTRAGWSILHISKVAQEGAGDLEKAMAGKRDSVLGAGVCKK